MPVDDFHDIQKHMEDSIESFMNKVPATQRAILDDILHELRKLELNRDDNTIKNTVKNIRLMGSIKNKINRLVVTDDYIKDVKQYTRAFDKVTTMQNEYWKSVEEKFKPKTLLREIKIQTIDDTVNKLTEAGIGANIADPITDILRSHITSGGSYKKLEQHLRNFLTDNSTGDGALTKYSRQITTDAIQQYNASYTQNVSIDLGYEWFRYQGTDIRTTRPFCDAMTDGDRKYFHISEIPALLRADNLYYSTAQGDKKVPIYEHTGLPNGMIEGTNAANFFVYRGGYNCRHQIWPVIERTVPLEARQRAYTSPAYYQWSRINKTDDERKKIADERVRIAETL